VAPAALARPDGYAQWYGYAATHIQAGGPDPWYGYAVAKGLSRDSTPRGTTFITDTLAPGGGTTSDVCMHAMPVTVVQAQACSTPEQPPVPAQPVGNGGFDWGIFGIAAGGALALLLGIFGGLRTRSQHEPTTV
jgi:hypothetical protein